MSVDATTVMVIALIFLATFVRATFGFADALIAMPLLALIIDIKIATPLVGLVGNTIALLIIWKTWRSVHLKSAWRLVLSAAFGVPIGILLLKTAYVGEVKFILGVVIIAFSAFELVRPKLRLKGDGKSPFLFGFIGGILGGAYNSSGPAVVIYGTLRRFPPDVFRATLQGYFLPTGLIVLVGHGLSGLWTREVIRLYLCCAPFVLAAVIFGSKISGTLLLSRFQKLIHLLLIVIGFLLLIDVWIKSGLS